MRFVLIAVESVSLEDLVGSHLPLLIGMFPPYNTCSISKEEDEGGGGGGFNYNDLPRRPSFLSIPTNIPPYDDDEDDDDNDKGDYFVNVVLFLDAAIAQLMTKYSSMTTPQEVVQKSSSFSIPPSG